MLFLLIMIQSYIFAFYKSSTYKNVRYSHKRQNYLLSVDYFLKMKPKITKEIHCPVRKTLEIIGGKWTLYIIHQIGNNTIRYGELKRTVEGISEKIFANELKMLVENGIVCKKSYAEIPPRVEYSLTDLGKDFLPIIENLAEIGKKRFIIENVKIS